MIKIITAMAMTITRLTSELEKANTLILEKGQIKETMTRLSEKDLTILLNRANETNKNLFTQITNNNLRSLCEEVKAYRKASKEPQMEDKESFDNRTSLPL